MLDSWSESRIEVIVRGRDSDAWLARFGGTLGVDEGSGLFAVHVGGPEAWVNAAPLSFRDAFLAREDVLVIRHDDGETTIRRA